MQGDIKSPHLHRDPQGVPKVLVLFPRRSLAPPARAGVVHIVLVLFRSAGVAHMGDTSLTNTAAIHYSPFNIIPLPSI